MTEAEVLLLLGVVFMALWSRSIFLMIGGVITSFLMCGHWYDLEGSWTYACAPLLLAFGLLFKVIYDGMKGRLKV